LIALYIFKLVYFLALFQHQACQLLLRVIGSYVFYHQFDADKNKNRWFRLFPHICFCHSFVFSLQRCLWKCSWWCVFQDRWAKISLLRFKAKWRKLYLQKVTYAHNSDFPDIWSNVQKSLDRNQNYLVFDFSECGCDKVDIFFTKFLTSVNDLLRISLYPESNGVQHVLDISLTCDTLQSTALQSMSVIHITAVRKPPCAVHLRKRKYCLEIKIFPRKICQTCFMSEIRIRR